MMIQENNDLVTFVAVGYFKDQPNVNGLMFDHAEYMGALINAIDSSGGLPLTMAKPKFVDGNIEIDPTDIRGFVKTAHYDRDGLSLNVAILPAFKDEINDLIANKGNAAYASMLGEIVAAGNGFQCCSVKSFSAHFLDGSIYENFEGN